MPKLTRTDDELHVSLSGSPDFQTALNQVKAIPGRRFDGDSKLWKFPRDPAIAERILLTLKPIADAGILSWVRNSRAERESELATKLPTDAELLIPWADRLFAYQRAAVAFGARHPRFALCDDMGTGKSLQSLSIVYEFLLSLACGKDSNSGGSTALSSDVRQETSGSPEEVQSLERASSPGPLAQDNSRRKEAALRGLWTPGSSGGDGPGSRPGPEGVYVWQLPDIPFAARYESGSGNYLGASEVRSALSHVPSIAAHLGKAKLIAAPNSAKGVWAREIVKWLGSDEPHQIVDAGTAPKRENQLQAAIKEGGWCIVNWEQLRAQKHETEKTVHHRDGSTSTDKVVTWSLRQELFGATDWLAAIGDEAHRAKNYKALVTRGLWMIDAPIKIAATGTPLMNAPNELWSILKWLYPEQYGKSSPGHPRTAYWAFHDQYTDSYEGYKGSRVIVGVKNPDALRFELKDRLVRRTKGDVLDLPPKVREIVPIKLNDKQQKLYDEAEDAFWLEVEQAVKDGDKAAKRFAEEVADGKKTIFEISNGAARTVRLRQIASTPALLGGPDDSAKFDAIVENISDNKHQQHVVFCEFVESCNLLAARIRKLGLSAEAFTGDVKDTRIRTYYEDRFQGGEIDVLVGTLGAMRESITLTNANVVHFSERAWVPGWNEQAEDRLHRNGQEDRVTVLIYEAQDTVDTEKVSPTNSLKELIVASVIKKDKVEQAA